MSECYVQWALAVQVDCRAPIMATLYSSVHMMRECDTTSDEALRSTSIFQRYLKGVQTFVHNSNNNQIRFVITATRIGQYKPHYLHYQAPQTPLL